MPVDAPLRIGVRAYRFTGFLCLAVGLPFWISLAAGRLAETRNPWVLLSILGSLPGLLLLAFGTGRLTRNGLSDTAFRVTWIGFAFVVGFLGSGAAVALGAELLGTAQRFCGMAASYFAFMSFILLVAAAARGRPSA